VPLCDSQRAFAEAMIDGKPQRVAAALAPEHSNLRHVALYRRLIRNNYVQVLRITYPALSRFMGDRQFALFARWYGQAYPSASGDLFPYGRSFPALLQRIGAPETLTSLAQLEWACHQLYQAADHPPWLSNRLPLIACDGSSRVMVRCHPAARFLSFPSPVHRLWLALQPDVASDEDLVWPLPDEPTIVAAARAGGRVLITPLSRLEYALLGTLSIGVDVASLEQWVRAAGSEFDLTEFIGRLTSRGVIVGCWVEEGT
jgi:hypothetical protein